MSRFRTVATSVAFLAAAAVCGAVACDGAGVAEPGEPRGAPYMSGRVTSVVQTGGFAGTIRVEAVPSNPNVGLKAVARVDAATVVIGVDGKAGEFRSISTGQWVRLWFDGAIAESYPVQGTAVTVRIDSLGVTPIGAAAVGAALVIVAPVALRSPGERLSGTGVP